MPLRESKGNMYDWCTHTWNPITGECRHQCAYCYMRKFKQGPLRLKSRELYTWLGHDRTIFIGSSTDMFASDVKAYWLRAVLDRCCKFPRNNYLFQSKNPERFIEFDGKYPHETSLTFATTIETNRLYPDSWAPHVWDRASAMARIEDWAPLAHRSVTIEPVMDFDIDEMIKLMMMCKPAFVSIGADSQDHGLEEPSREKIQELISKLERFTTIRVKHNLERLEAQGRRGQERRK